MKGRVDARNPSTRLENPWYNKSGKRTRTHLIATLDGVEQEADVLARTLKYNDGRHDDLKHAPADTRLL